MRGQSDAREKQAVSLKQDMACFFTVVMTKIFTKELSYNKDSIKLQIKRKNVIWKLDIHGGMDLY